MGMICPVKNEVGEVRKLGSNGSQAGHCIFPFRGSAGPEHFRVQQLGRKSQPPPPYMRELSVTGKRCQIPSSRAGRLCLQELLLSNDVDASLAYSKSSFSHTLER